MSILKAAAGCLLLLLLLLLTADAAFLLITRSMNIIDQENGLFSIHVHLLCGYVLNELVLFSILTQLVMSTAAAACLMLLRGFGLPRQNNMPAWSPPYLLLLLMLLPPTDAYTHGETLTGALQNAGVRNPAAVTESLLRAELRTVGDVAELSAVEAAELFDEMRAASVPLGDRARLRKVAWGRAHWVDEAPGEASGPDGQPTMRLQPGGLPTAEQIFGEQPPTVGNRKAEARVNQSRVQL